MPEVQISKVRSSSATWLLSIISIPIAFKKENGVPAYLKKRLKSAHTHVTFGVC